MRTQRRELQGTTCYGNSTENLRTEQLTYVIWFFVIHLFHSDGAVVSIQTSYFSSWKEVYSRYNDACADVQAKGNRLDPQRRLVAEKPCARLT